MKHRFKKFVSYYKPYRGLFFGDMACAVVVAAIALVLPLIVRYVTKDVLESGLDGAVGRIWQAGAAMVALMLVQTACNYFVDYKGHAMGAMMEGDMREELFAHCQRLSFTFHDGHRTGELMSRITNDLLSMTEFCHHAPEDYVIHSIKFVGSLAILTSVNAGLALAVFLFMPVMAAFLLVFNGRLGGAFRRSREKIADVNAGLEDNLSGIRVVQSFANEDFEAGKFARTNREYVDSRKTIYRNEAFLYQGMVLLSQLITVAVVVFGGIAITHASLDLADLVTFLLYIGYLIEPVQRLPWMVQQFQEGITGFARCMEILEQQPDIHDSADAVDLIDVRGDVSFMDVAFRYRDGQDYVLKGLTLDVRAGETVALVGYSGVGKTTLCSLIPRFYDASEGAVLLDGVDVRGIRLNSLRRNVGVVEQDVYLFAGTVLENIRYGRPEASQEEVVEAAKRANAHEFILALPQGYDTDIGQRGVKLSGGQRQRLSIARAFLKDPPVLILDEATSALDSESEKAVRDSLESLSRNRTVFVIAHRLSTVRSSQRIIVLSGEGIEEQGSHEELMAAGGAYSRLYNLQFTID